MKKTLNRVLLLTLLVSGYFAVSMLALAPRKIEIFSSFGPPKNAASFNDYTLNAIAALKDGNVPTGTRTSPTDFRAAMNVSANDLMTTTSTPFYQGNFSPTGAWSNERGSTVWHWIVATAGEGELIALSDISVVMSSSDFGNALNKTVTFNGPDVTYSPTAIGILGDGTVITSGPATQLVKKVIVGVGSKSFPVNNDQDVKTVANYLSQSKTWNTTAVATVKGVSESRTLNLHAPALMASVSNGRLMVSAENNGDPLTYNLQVSPSIESNAHWVPVGHIKAGETNDIAAITDQQMLFVRYAPIISAQSILPTPTGH